MTINLPEDRIEKFLEHLCVFFYKHDDRNVTQFLSQLETVYELAFSLDISIYNIPDYVDEKKAEIKKLEEKISILKQQVEKENSEFICTVKNTEKYIAARRYGQDHPN